MSLTNKKDAAKKNTENGPVVNSATLPDDLKRHFHYTLGRDEVGERPEYLYHALALTVRDHLLAKTRSTNKLQPQPIRRAAYLSLEFLMGRALSNAVLNLDLEPAVSEALNNYGCDLETLSDAENDAGLGNGGLGRLAACFLDSCASLALPVIGYGIRYEYGMFNQTIEDGYQVEHPDNWLRNGNPWETIAAEQSQRIKFFGHVETYQDKSGKTQRQWVDTEDVLAMPYDVPIPGYQNDIVNKLRLWKSLATDEFDLNEFNAGSYTEAVARKNLAEQITMVLYPNDNSENGKELRLRQQYFLCSASLQDILTQWLNQGKDFSDFADFHVFQLNDTHPSIAVAELMRLLIDDHDLDWDKAWEITSRTMAYTNHTLLPEALEKWSVSLFSRLLPRLIEIIYEINARFLIQVACKWPGDTNKQRDLSIIEEGHEPQLRMAHLAIIGSFSVNGVAALHTKLLTQGLFNLFYQLWPNKFNNKTNGVTPRRWLHHCNPKLSSLITDKIGPNWTRDLSEIAELKSHSSDNKFQQQWLEVRQQNKKELANLVLQSCDVNFPSHMLFDVQVKRMHEYKRQLLNVLHIIHLYEQIRRGETQNMVPRCVLIGGKSAPGYAIAKLTIKLINNVAATINADPQAQPWLRVAFLPNYNVTAMETICAATDLSEQISTAGKEASGTGNMKFMMNGAVTIGTLDGANIEIKDAVGENNFFLFGAQAEQVQEIISNYDPRAIVANNIDFQRVMGLLESNHFNLFEPSLFQPIIDSIYNPHDQWLVAHDFLSYCESQQHVANAYKDQKKWARLSILNTAACGIFSSDRTIQQYNKDIWKLSPIK